MLCLGGMPRRRYEQGAVVARTRGVGDGEESALAVLRLDSFLALPPPRRHAGLVPGPKARPQHLPVDLEGVIPAQDVDRPVYSRLRSAAADGRGSTDGKRARGPCISHPRHNGALTRRPCPMAGRGACASPGCAPSARRFDLCEGAFPIRKISRISDFCRPLYDSGWPK